MINEDATPRNLSKYNWQKKNEKKDEDSHHIKVPISSHSSPSEAQIPRH